MIFEFEKKVRFGEIDEAGIVYYPRFFNFYHLAMEEFFEKAVGVPYPEIIKGWKVGFPTVHVEADFLSPLKYGDVMLIAVSFAKVGRSSCTNVPTVMSSLRARSRFSKGAKFSTIVCCW